jgi:hemolysin D
MVIVPKTTTLQIEATLANKDVGFVRVGQAVEVKVETFTFTRYGLLHGAIASISRDVVAPDQSSPDRSGGGPRTTDAEVPKDEQERQSRQPAYVAQITVSETGIETEDGWRTLEPGMAVTAEIKTGRRRLISYLLSPLMRYRHEGLRER